MSLSSNVDAEPVVSLSLFVALFQNFGQDGSTDLKHKILSPYRKVIGFFIRNFAVQILFFETHINSLWNHYEINFNHLQPRKVYIHKYLLQMYIVG